MSWVQVPPEAADFSLEKSLPQVSLNCVVFLCILEGVSKFVYHVPQWTQTHETARNALPTEYNIHVSTCTGILQWYTNQGKHLKQKND